MLWRRYLNAHVSQGGWPVLVLNADFRPLSYYPLSLWSWQDAIKAVFLDRVNIVEHYDRAVRSPSFEIQLPSVVSLKSFVRPTTHPAFTRFNVFLRDRFVLLGRRRSYLRSHPAAQQGRPDHMGERGRGMFAVQSTQGQSDATAGADVPAPAPIRADGTSTAPQRPAVPAELSARQLAGLFILGYRARSVGNGRRIVVGLIPKETCQRKRPR
jgi:hypothetical protein